MFWGNSSGFISTWRPLLTMKNLTFWTGLSRIHDDAVAICNKCRQASWIFNRPALHCKVAVGLCRPTAYQNYPLCLVHSHTADTDKTSLSTLCRFCELNWRQDKTVFSSLQHIWLNSFVESRNFETVYKTAKKLNMFSFEIFSISVQTADTDKTRQFCLVRRRRKL